MSFFESPLNMVKSMVMAELFEKLLGFEKDEYRVESLTFGNGKVSGQLWLTGEENLIYIEVMVRRVNPSTFEIAEITTSRPWMNKMIAKWLDKQSDGLRFTPGALVAIAVGKALNI